MSTGWTKTIVPAVAGMMLGGGVALLLLLWPAAALAAGGGSLSVDDFEHGLGPEWTVKAFKGETGYQIVTDAGSRVLQADSRGTASGLVKEIDLDPREFPVLAWRWKVAGTIARGDEQTKAGDDYAARVYVIFPHWFFPKTRTLNYIWANRLPQGAFLANAFTGNAVMIAVRSGPAQAGQWFAERRNIVDDYRRAFGEEPPRIGAIAIMTDTDNTGAAATAWYDDLALSKE